MKKLLFCLALAACEDQSMCKIKKCEMSIQQVADIEGIPQYAPLENCVCFDQKDGGSDASQ